jgi:hypothetical protein
MEPPPDRDSSRVGLQRVLPTRERLGLVCGSWKMFPRDMPVVSARRSWGLAQSLIELYRKRQRMTSEHQQSIADYLRLRPFGRFLFATRDFFSTLNPSISIRHTSSYTMSSFGLAHSMAWAG